MKPRILVDMDGVLVFSNNSHLEKINKEFGKDYKFEDINDFGAGFMQERERKRFLELWDEKDYGESDFAFGAERGLLKLNELGDVFIVTSPMVGHIESKFRFLLKRFDKNQIVLTSNKKLVMDYYPTILIDDGPHNIDEAPDNVYTIIFDKPWNKDVEANLRVSNWHEIARKTQDFLELEFNPF